MKISVIGWHEVDASLLARWREIRSAHAALRSPYYSVGFTQMVAKVCPDVRLAVIEDGQGVVGFFPHHRESYGRICNVGRVLSDYHGLIAAPDLALTAAQLLKGIGGRYMTFPNLPMTQAVLAPHVRFRHDSSVICLEGGMAAVLERNAQAHGGKKSSVFKDAGNRIRRLEADIGPVRFTLDSPDRADFDRLVERKSEQFVRTLGESENKLHVPWIRAAVYEIFSLHDEDFAGLHSTLHAGDRLVASMMSLRSGGQVHAVMPAYDTELSCYSPGMAFFVEFVRAAASAGYSDIDFGSGDFNFKHRLRTGCVPMGRGAVSRPAFIARGLQTARAIKHAWLDEHKASQGEHGHEAHGQDRH